MWSRHMRGRGRCSSSRWLGSALLAGMAGKGFLRTRCRCGKGGVVRKE